MPGSGGTPIGFAALYDNITVLEVILSRGVSINQKDSWGWTAIHYVATSAADPISAANLLIEKNVNLNELTHSDFNGNPTGIFTPLDIANQSGRGGSSVYKLLKENGAKTGAELLEDRLTALEQKVEQGSSGNTNPTSEWPRKMWEIEFDLIDIYGANILTIANDGKTILVNIGGINKEGKSENIGAFLIRENGDYFQLTDSGSTLVKWSDQILFMSYDSLVVKENKNYDSNIVTLFQINNEEVIQRKFEHDQSVRFPPTSGKGIPQSSHLGVQIIEGTSKLICWDFTPPTLASTDNEGGNGDNEAPNSRLVVKTAGPDISIATDGKLGGPAELQKSDDLKNWRRLGDVPEDANEVLVTPRDSGNEFFRLKRIDE